MATRQSIEAVLSADTRPLKKDLKEAESLTAASARRMEKSSGGGGSGSSGKGKAAGGLLQAASAADDLQYGLKGVLNNVLGIAGYLGPVGKGMAAVAVIGGVIYQQWESIENLISQKLTGSSMKELEEQTKQLAKLTEEASRRAKLAADQRVEAMRAAGQAMREESEFLIAQSMERSTSEAHARVRELNKRIAESNIEMSSMSEREKIARMLELNKQFREDDFRARVQDMERFRTEAMTQERMLGAQLLEEREKLRALQEKADAQYINRGSVSTGLSAEVEGQKAIVKSIEQAQASAMDQLTRAQKESNNLVMERTALQKEGELDRLEAAKKVADLEKKAAEKAAETLRAGMADLFASVRRGIGEMMAALKKAADQADFREKNAEQRKIDEARAAGRERAARRMEQDRTERERSRELQDKGGIDKKEADKQAKQERQQQEDRDRGRRTSRRKPAAEKRGSLLDEPRTTNLDDGRQRMAPMFDPAQPKSPAAAPAAAGAQSAPAAADPGGVGGGIVVTLLRNILSAVQADASTNARRPINNPRAA